MTAQEKAKAGVWLLKEAVVEFIREHPEGITPAEVRDKLELNSPDKGGHKDNLLWGIHNLLNLEV